MSIFKRISDLFAAKKPENELHNLNISCNEKFEALRISTMKKTNPAAYKVEISKFNRKLRQSYLNELNTDISKILHPNTLNLIKVLKEKCVGTVVFDECHHLQSYWALVMKELVHKLGVANIIGLRRGRILKRGKWESGGGKVRKDKLPWDKKEDHENMEIEISK